MPKPITQLDIEARIVPGSVRWPSTAIHWEKLKKAVESLRATVDAVETNCRAIEQDRNLSLEGMTRKRAEIGQRACAQLSNFAAVKTAESAVSGAIGIFEAGMVDIPRPPTNAADVALAQEVRAHVRAQESPTTFVLNNMSDSRVVGAVLHAPGFLSGLNDEAVNIVRDRMRSALHPEQVKQRKAAEDALSELQSGVDAARRLILARTDTRAGTKG